MIFLWDAQCKKLPGDENNLSSQWNNDGTFQFHPKMINLIRMHCRPLFLSLGNKPAYCAECEMSPHLQTVITLPSKLRCNNSREFAKYITDVPINLPIHHKNNRFNSYHNATNNTKNCHQSNVVGPTMQCANVILCKGSNVVTHY